MASGVAPSSARKRKPRKLKGKDNDDGSVAGGRGSRAPADKSRGSRGRSQTVGESDDGGDEPTVEASAEREQAKEEQENRRLVLAWILTDNTVNDQEGFQRYEQWRATKLDKATIRRVCYI